jgi:uncharacterized protein YjbI with pentapeptide repeats
MNESDDSPAISEFVDPVSTDQFPDLAIYGYQICEKLSERSEIGKTTYLAKDIDFNRLVVIKQWQTLADRLPPLDYANYLPEVTRLQQLNHLNIPRYLDSFAVPTGFCVVREYQSGVSLAEVGDLPPADIKLVADAVLKILGYVHQLTPAIIHQNIKPENIIVNTEAELAIYLVDFGIHPAGDAQPKTGTPGFISPEQLFNLTLTPASDIYSLGVSLICLLTGTPSLQVQQLFNDKYQLQFQHLLPPDTDPAMVSWLETMVKPNRQHRYHDPATLSIVPRINSSAITDNLDSDLISTNSTPAFDYPLKPKQKNNWVPWAIGASILLTLGLLARQFIFPDDGELSPAQIAKNQELAKQAQFETSDRGKLLKEKRCTNCNLDNQNFAKAELTGAVLSQSSLNGANFSNANLTLAIFSDADLSGANFDKTNLRQAALYGAKLIGTNLLGANLSDAKLVYAKLKGSRLRNANLSNADLKFADFQQADLSAANLTNADLTNADLSYTNLRKANLTGAKLDTANLTGATMPDGSIHP